MSGNLITTRKNPAPIPLPIATMSQYRAAGHSIVALLRVIERDEETVA